MSKPESVGTKEAKTVQGRSPFALAAPTPQSGLSHATFQRALAAPRTLAANDIAQLQRTVGNQAVQRMLNPAQSLPSSGVSSVCPSSVRVGPANDRYEQEADRITAKLNLPGGTQAGAPPTQASSAPRRRLQRAQEAGNPVAPGGRVGSNGGVATSELESRLRQSKGSGSPLAPDLRRTLEPKLGADLSPVRVHTDKHAVQLSRQLGAKAFTHQNHIYYGAGQSPADLQLTAHEAVHTMQQGAVQQGAVQQDAVQRKGVNALPTGSTPVSRDGSGQLRRKFGFEIELPIFFTYTNPAATGVEATQRNDAMIGSKGREAFAPSPNFVIKADHNRELNALAGHEYNLSKAVFQGGASIIELVSKPWDEFKMTEGQVRIKAKEMAGWATSAYNMIKAGQTHVTGGYYLGSDMPGAMAFQSTMGYLQTTYGVKLSSVPKAFEQTAAVNPNIPHPNKPNKTVHDNLNEANRIGVQIAGELRKFGEFQDATPADFMALQGYITLLANYLLSTKEKSKEVGLGKNNLGQFFYKSDMGEMFDALPDSIYMPITQNTMCEHAIVTKLLESTGRKGDDVAREWVEGSLQGEEDFMLNNMMNPYSDALGPDRIGEEGDEEAAVIMENRDPQFLDPEYSKKDAKYQKQLKKYDKKAAKDKKKQKPHSLADRAKAMATMTDPKKYPVNKWEDMFVLVYRMVKQLNSPAGALQPVAPAKKK